MDLSRAESAFNPGVIEGLADVVGCEVSAADELTRAKAARFKASLWLPGIAERTRCVSAVRAA